MRGSLLCKSSPYPIVSLAEGTSSHDFYSDLFLRHDLPLSPDVEVETIDQVLPAVRCNLGIGFVPREMLVAVPELTGVYPLTLDEPIAPRSIYLFQRKNQPLSIAAKHLRQMLLGDRSREVKKLPTLTASGVFCKSFSLITGYDALSASPMDGNIRLILLPPHG